LGLLTLLEELEGSRTVDQEREVWSLFIHAIFGASFCDLFGTEVSFKNEVGSRGSRLLRNVCNLMPTTELL